MTKRALRRHGRVLARSTFVDTLPTEPEVVTYRRSRRRIHTRLADTARMEPQLLP